jgi:site-specific recombinase XerD
MQDSLLDPGLEKILLRYHHHCRQVAGFAASTCASRVRRARLFLEHYSASGPVDLAQLSATALVGYLAKSSADYSPQSLPQWISGVRCFLRFLRVEELIPVDLDSVLLSVARPATDPPPKYLSAEQEQQLLSAIDRRTSLGRRDYAILLGLARLGLRAGEIAQLTFDEIQWEEGVFSLGQTKSRRARSLPLPQAVGEAWVAYLRRGRPPTPLRQLFVSSHQPPRALKPATVSSIVNRALVRAGLSLPCGGARGLRHTLATHLVQKGASLKEVADLLGHQQLATTTRYAKVNRPMLAEVAQPWPEVHS